MPAGQAATHPVHNEDLAHIQPLLEKFGCHCHGVEVAEPPGGETSGYCFYTTLSRHLESYGGPQGKDSWFLTGDLN